VTFLAGDINISVEEVTIKLESVKATHPQLEYESKVYKTLAGGVGVPFVRWFGTECEYNATVIDLLGPSRICLTSATIFRRICDDQYKFPPNRDVSLIARELVQEIITPNHQECLTPHNIIDHSLVALSPSPRLATYSSLLLSRFWIFSPLHNLAE
jgi:hypothetical protein